MNSILKKILAALKRFVTVNVGYKIMAVIFAIILWLVVVNIQNPASNRTFTNIPVDIINEESVLDGDNVYTIKSGKTATISVAGTRSVLSNLSASDFEAVADFSALSLTNAAPISVSLKSDKARYESQIDITPKTTSMVIDVESLVTNDFSVQIHYIGTKPDDLTIDKIEMSPDQITVSAPESVANEMSSVGIMVNYEDIRSNEPLELVPNLYDQNGNEIKLTDQITLSNDAVTAQFITYEEKTVPVKIEPFGTPAEGYQLADVSQSRTEATIKGPTELLEEVDAIELPSRLLTISDKTSNVTATINLMDYLPDGLSFADSSGNYYMIATANIEKIAEETTTAAEEATAAESETTGAESEQTGQGDASGVE